MSAGLNVAARLPARLPTLPFCGDFFAEWQPGCQEIHA